MFYWNQFRHIIPLFPLIIRKKWSKHRNDSGTPNLKSNRKWRLKKQLGPQNFTNIEIPPFRYGMKCNKWTIQKLTFHYYSPIKCKINENYYKKEDNKIIQLLIIVDLKLLLAPSSWICNVELQNTNKQWASIYIHIYEKEEQNWSIYEDS